MAAVTLITSLAMGTPLAATADAAAASDMGKHSRREKDKQLDSVQVIGQADPTYGGEYSASPKFTQPLVDTTQTVNIIASDLFNEQGATSLTDALRNSPGVGTFYVGENGNTTTGDAVYLRGFDSAGSIFVDGVRDLGAVSRDVFNVEQIEVTKGPAGTDNGRTAPTGAINLVTKQAHLQNQSAASVSFGSADQKRVTADLNQTLGDGENAAFRINLMSQDSGVPGRDEIERKRWGIAPSLAFGLDGMTRVYFDVLHVRQDNTPDGGVPTIGLTGYSTPDPLRPEIGLAPRVDPENFYGTKADHDDVTIDMVTVRVEHEFSDDLRLHNTTRWGRNEQDYLLTSFMTSQDTARFQTPDVNDPASWTVARSLPTFKDQTNRILTNQTNLSGHFDSGSAQHDFSVGVELTREELYTRGVAVLAGTSWPVANLYNPDPNVSGLRWAHNGADSEGRTDTASLYAFDTLTLNTHWELNAGARLDHYRTDFSSLVVCGSRGNPVCGSLPEATLVPGVDASISDTLFNWKLGALYKPSDSSSIYANYAISQQPPGGASLEFSSRPNNPNNPNFDPQKAETAEIGAKWNLFGDDLLLTAAIYSTTVSNEITQDPVDQQYVQTGEKRVRGVELSAVGHISEAWAVSAGYTTMDTDVLVGSVVTADGSGELTYTPKQAFTAWTSYRIGPRVSIGGGARYSGGLKRGRDGAVGTPTYTESYWVFDAVATYSVNEHVDVRLNLNNLFDEDFVSAINKSGYRYSPGLPRNVLLTADIRF